MLRVQAAEGQGQATCSLDDDEQHGEGKEQPEEEAFIEEEPPWSQDPCLAWFVSGGVLEPPDAPELYLRPHKLGGLLMTHWSHGPAFPGAVARGPQVTWTHRSK